MTEIYKAPPYWEWKPKMNIEYLCKDLFRNLPRYIRDDVSKCLREGPPLPDRVYEDLGIKPEHLPNPRKAAVKALQDRHTAAALVKNLVKLGPQKLGALARPIPTNSRGIGVMYELPTYAVGSFDVTKDGKTRMVMDLSQRALPGFFARYSPAAIFCYNDGFSDIIATMGFCDLSDRAALMLMVGSVVLFSNSDFAGWFNNPPDHPSQVRYHILTVAVPKGNEVTDETPTIGVPIMSNVQGSKIAAVTCAKISVGIMMAADKIAVKRGKDLFSLPYHKVTKPEEYGLKPCPLTYEQLRARKDMKPRISNPARWIEQRRSILCRWRTLKPGQRMPSVIVHQDDILMANSTVDVNYEALCEAHGIFEKADIPTSTECAIENVSDDKIFCGNRLMPDHKISISEKRWLQYSQNVMALGHWPSGLPLGFLLTLAGQIAYVMDLFPKHRPMFAPLTWYLAQVNSICKDNKAMWRKWKTKIVQVPAIIIAMVIEAWATIYKRSANAVDLVKLDFDANRKFSCDWCPDGFGAIDHDSGEYFAVKIPRGHELSENRSSFGEFFTLIVACRTWCKKGDDVSIDEDNEGCIAIVEKYMAKPSYCDLTMVFGQWSIEMEVTVFPRYTRTSVIIADPLSRSHEPGWREEFKERAANFGVEVGEEIQVEWEEIFEEALQIRKKYLIPHTLWQLFSKVL